jgi:hypothetical protein
MSSPRHLTGHRRFHRSIAIAAGLAAVASGTVALAPPASALTLIPTCAPVATSKVFTPWGDLSNYFLIPGGGFEAGTTAWTLKGDAKVVSGNETYAVHSKTDTRSLALSTGAQATSPTACVAMGENTIRSFVKNPGVAGSVLHVDAYVQNPLTGLVLAFGYDIQGKAGSTQWSPGSPQLIPNLLGGIAGTQNLKLVFTAKGKAATWNIDDVFVDPFKSR